MGYKISNLIIGVTIASLMIGLFMLGLNNSASKNPDMDFDNETLSRYNSMETMLNQSKTIRDNESAMGRRGSLNDILGDWFEQGYNTLRAAKTSYETVEDLSENASQDLNLGSPGVLLKTAIGIIIVVIVVLGIIISTLVKRES